MNIDQILSVFGKHSVDYLLIGGVNFLLNHAPELTFDLDLWVRDDDENLQKANAALQELRAEWGPTEHDWKPVPAQQGWLRRQTVFCLTSPYGAIDIFREVKGLEGKYEECKRRAQHKTTTTGVGYTSLSDEDMLQCQLALPEAARKPGRVEALKRSIVKRR
jgi:hypothetical protein